MIYIEERGNIFDLPKSDYVFAHCIACDLRWGAGIAPKMFEEFNLTTFMRKECIPEALSVGSIYVVSCGSSILINLLTKQNTYDKPTYSSLESTLLALKTYMLQIGKTMLAIPKIGCGLDRLDWDKVSVMIRQIFADTDITVVVRYL